MGPQGESRTPASFRASGFRSGHSAHNPQATASIGSSLAAGGGPLPESSAHACPPQRRPPPDSEPGLAPALGQSSGAQEVALCSHPPGVGPGPGGPHGGGEAGAAPKGSPLPVSYDLHQTPTGLSAQFSPEPHAVCLPHRPSPHLLQTPCPQAPAAPPRPLTNHPGHFQGPAAPCRLSPCRAGHQVTACSRAPYDAPCAHRGPLRDLGPCFPPSSANHRGPATTMPPA